MAVHKQCLLCRSSNLTTMKGYEEARLVRCGTCNFVFAGDIPTPEELVAHYETYPRNDYLSPITITRFHEILDAFQPFRQTNRMLDVGCGIGLFLEIAKERGWEVHGTEFTDRAVEICHEKGIQMQQGVLNSDNYEPASFDVVTSFEVIEHINNPRQDVAQVKTILRSGGAFYITTPNFNSLSRTVLGPKWNVIEYPEHLSYYTPRTIRLLLAKCGFSRVGTKTTGISPTRLKAGLRPNSDAAPVHSADSDDEHLRLAMEGNSRLRLAKDAVNGALKLSGKGDALKVLAVKS